MKVQFCILPYRYGFNSEGHEKVFERVKLEKEEKDKAVIGVNLGKNKLSETAVEDYVSGVQKFGKVADYLVINISSPNVYIHSDLDLMS